MALKETVRIHTRRVALIYCTVWGLAEANVCIFDCSASDPGGSGVNPQMSDVTLGNLFKAGPVVPETLS